MTDLAETLRELGSAQVKLMHRNDLLVEALGRIATHPVATPVAGRSELGVDPIPSCQDIARVALEADAREATQ